MIEQVRAFNRLFTRRIGVLSDNYLGRGRPLAESRLLFEIGESGIELRQLRERLSLDSGYLSRLLQKLAGEGLLQVGACARDARVREVRLTARGLRERRQLDERSQSFAASLLAPLGPAQRERLVAAMAEVERLLRAAAVEIDAVDPQSADARTCIAAYLAELDARFPDGFDASRSPSADPGELLPPNGYLLLARLDGQALGCGAVKRLDRDVAEIKRMWVAPSSRSLGIAQRLLEALEARALELGCRRVRLDTNGSLTEARALYARNGYVEIADYNDNPYADHWFEKRIGPTTRGPAAGTSLRRSTGRGGRR
ncbi:bifunctional helix-turn-helix transcriptional regulator/GNAT family N-acetyltransferase [Pseudomarimonas salicorniae]|uniref:Helix-turn-helix domain-containing GNAT family N-acetyltransferase n=1 Tax=Pseudomarimonas salicorniae TaxID=2933270 RepID=A0ABT0GHS0_9GAMM|nr:helix-turn-helix domain-containing GNAT family N-acetyltransferase [Lysobacter sp. CAU 1642]MCK7594097.1 helix-turn-helix domain-containing GNAT family N-acetyltransferase [Lysobacter sp. CAU 1642]